MHQFFGLLMLAALVVLMMRLPGKAVAVCLIVAGLFWLLTPGPVFGPWFGHMHVPAFRMGLPPHVHSLLWLVLLAAAVGAVLVFARGGGSSDKMK